MAAQYRQQLCVNGDNPNQYRLQKKIVKVHCVRENIPCTRFDATGKYVRYNTVVTFYLYFSRTRLQNRSIDKF